MKKINVALAGNPNSGKTTLFNMLTGARQHVGNYPGVTVEKVEGMVKYKDYEINFIDLPGTYSLTAYSQEELVARHYIHDEAPDVVVDVIDSSNVERNLYLATQLMEMQVPLVLAFNMHDLAIQKGLVFDLEQLSVLIGTEIVTTIASKKQGRVELFEAIIRKAEDKFEPKGLSVNYGDEIEGHIEQLVELIKKRREELAEEYNLRWLAVKLLEKDEDILKIVNDEEIKAVINEAVGKIKLFYGDEPEILFADLRYGFISGACQETI